MRDYIQVFFFTFHAHTAPNLDVDGEKWYATAEETFAGIESERASWEGSGWSFAVTNSGASYWRLSKELFVEIVQKAAQSVNFVNPADVTDRSYSMVGDDIIVFESPRGKERPKFKLVPR